MAYLPLYLYIGAPYVIRAGLITYLHDDASSSMGLMEEQPSAHNKPSPAHSAQLASSSLWCATATRETDTTTANSTDRPPIPSHGGLPRRLLRCRGRRGGCGLRHADSAPPHAAAARARRLRLRAPVARRHGGPGRRRLARQQAELPRHGEQPARILLLLPRGRRLLLRRLLVLRGSRLRRDPRPERILERNLALSRLELRF